MAKRTPTDEAMASLKANWEFTSRLTKVFPLAPNYASAIRRKCLDCCCGDRSLVDGCEIRSCALWPFRMGNSPFKARRK